MLLFLKLINNYEEKTKDNTIVKEVQKCDL